MSKDSSHTYLHFHASHHADLFEEFCHPPSSRLSASGQINLNNQTNSSSDPADPDLIHMPGYFLPFESIHLPSHLMPINPEDEDGVVPDMHAAFGIVRAMGQGMEPSVQGERSGRGVLGSARVEEVWRDLGVERLVNGVGELDLVANRDGNQARVGGVGAVNIGSGLNGGAVNGVRREGRRRGILSVR